MDPAKLAGALTEAATLHNKGDLDKAEPLYRQILKKVPQQPDALHLLGVLTDQRGNRTDGIKLVRQALALRDAFPDAHFNLARMLLAAGDAGGAKDHYEKTLAFSPGYAKAYNGLGILYRAQRAYPEAVAAFERAIRLDGRLLDAYINLCNTYRDSCNEAEILKVVDAGLAVDPNNAQLWLLRSEASFTLGHLADGWRDYEWRFVIAQQPVGRPNYALPTWKGEDLAGKGLLIWCEQGVGDELLFSSMIAGVASRARRCVLQTTPRLAPLFARSFRNVEVFGGPIPADIVATLDIQSSQGGLGQWCRPTFRSFPAATDYLKADPARTAALRAKYVAGRVRSLVVGLSWRSANVVDGTTIPDVVEKSVGLNQWGAILSVPGVTFVNLQYGDTRNDIAAARTEFGVDIIDDPNINSLADLDGFAAQVAAMDVVISSSNTAAHMAGALGVPVWCATPRALSSGRRWYWFGHGRASPWYRSMTLFRQTQPGVWSGVLAEIGLALVAAAASTGVLDQPAQFLARLTRGYLSAGMVGEALQSVEQAIGYEPGSADLYALQGTILSRAERFLDAIAAYRRALSHAPDRAELYNNLGTALRRAGHAREASENYSRAHALKPEHPSIHLNHATALLDIGRLQEALSALDALVASQPDHVDAQYNRALVLMGLGRFAEGWKAFAWRMKRAFVHVRHEDFPQPVWAGENLKDKHVLVWTDTGLGDEILLGSLIPDLAAAARRVTLLCSERLVALFRRSFPGVTVDVRKSPLPAAALSKDIDLQMSLAELGAAFRPTLESFPAREKYLAVDDGLRGKLRKKYLAAGGKNLLVGISWRSINPEIGAQKSLPLAAWLPILKVRGVTFINLQYGDCRAEIDVLRREHGVRIIDDTDINILGDMDAVAAQVAAMDRVISISNTTVHLAGAAGVRVWVLLPKGQARLWYWFRGLDRCAWYPQATLMTSTKENDWSPLIAETAAMLTQVVEAAPHG